MWKFPLCMDSLSLWQLFPCLLGPAVRNTSVELESIQQLQNRHCWFETLTACKRAWKQCISHSKEMICMHACTHVRAVHILLSDNLSVFCLSCNVSDWLILYLGCASKINALVKHCWVCMHLGVKVRRNGFVNVPGCHDPSMAKCWKVNPICSNYTVSNVRECLLPTG